MITPILNKSNLFIQSNQLYYYDSPIGNIVDYVKALIDSMTIQIERGHIRKGYWDKTYHNQYPDYLFVPQTIFESITEPLCNM